MGRFLSDTLGSMPSFRFQQIVESTQITCLPLFRLNLKSIFRDISLYKGISVKKLGNLSIRPYYKCLYKLVLFQYRIATPSLVGFETVKVCNWIASNENSRSIAFLSTSPPQGVFLSFDFQSSGYLAIFLRGRPRSK